MKTTLKAGLLALTTALAGNAGAETIDIMVLYTQPAANAVSNIDTKINQYISHANRIYQNNAVDIKLRLVGQQPGAATSSDMKPSEADLDTLTNSSGVKNARAGSKADMVVLLGTREVTNNGYVCGIGWVGQGRNGSLYSSAKSKMYSISGVDCAATTFVHELGHNMGLGHSVRQGSTGGVFKDGIGHGVNNNFSTIMAYPQAYGSAGRLDYFSDPAWNGCNGLACGVTGESNAYRAIQAVKDDIANFF
jgi:hypothetical protein